MAFIRYLPHDAGTGAEVALLIGHAEQFGSIAFSPNDSNASQWGWNETSRLWDARI